MKYFTYLILLLLLSSNIHAQVWTPVSPYPSEFTYLSMHIDEKGTGLFVGQDGIITKTSDFGTSFYNIQSGTRHELSSIDKIHDDIYIAVGNAGTILRSNNGGENWKIVPYPGNERLFKVYFVNETVGFILGADGLVLRTSDAGIIWNKIDLGNKFDYKDILFTSEMIGYIWSQDYHNYYKTIDGGSDWVEINTGFQNRINTISFSDNDNGKLYLYKNAAGGFIFETTNGGEDWHEITDDSPNLQKTIFLNKSFGIGSTRFHRIYYTENGGETWTLFDHNAHEIYVDNIEHIYTLTSRGIFRSVDLGATWEELSFSIPSNGFFKVHMYENSEIYMAGSGYTILKSEDAGKTFKKLDIPGIGSGTFCDIIKISENIIVAVGEFSDIFISNDSGESWDKIDSGLQSFHSIDKFGNVIRIVDVSGSILYSNDLGESWEIKETNIITNSFSFPVFIQFVNPMRGFVILSGGDIWSTNDGGEFWVQMEGLAPIYRNGIHFIDENIGYLVGLQHVYKSEDGGETWISISTDLPPYTFYSIHFRNEDTGYISGEEGRIMKSEDGGITWYDQITFSKDYYFSIGFNHDGVGIAAGAYHTILRIEEGSLSSSQVEEVMKLPNMVIFPNPAAHEIHLPSGNFTDRSVLNIYSMDGNLISEIKGNLQGEPIHVRHLPAGMYILLHSNGEVLEKGMFVKQ